MTTTETDQERTERLRHWLAGHRYMQEFGRASNIIHTAHHAGDRDLRRDDVEWLLGEVSRLRGVLDGLRTRLEDAAAEENAENDPRWNNGREWGLTMALRFLAELYPPAGQEGATS